jgi:uncharacterized protein YdaU (DUF1376 family)
MSKDPAFLFYPGDWLSGTQGMTFEEKGAYLELLVLQFNRGHMSGHMVGQVVGQIWDGIKEKFIQDEAGLWYNERLDKEKEKRKAYSNSRRNNLKGNNQYKKINGHVNGHMTSHMENENHTIINNIKGVKIFEEKLAAEFSNQFTQIENLARLTKTSTENVKSLIPEFVLILASKNRINEPFKEQWDYFVNWYKLEVKKQKKSEPEKPKAGFSLSEYGKK